MAACFLKFLASNKCNCPYIFIPEITQGIDLYPGLEVGPGVRYCPFSDLKYGRRLLIELKF